MMIIAIGIEEVACALLSARGGGLELRLEAPARVRTSCTHWTVLSLVDALTATYCSI